MQPTRRGITLIGMPGAGKSTAGVLIAKNLALEFLDTDIVIQVQQERTLQDILDTEGYLRLRKIEEEVLLGLDAHGKLLATGGSAVYSDAAMRHLASTSSVVYLEVPLEELRRRIRNYDTRGIARRPDQDFHELFAERTALYRRYADATIHCLGMDIEAVVEAVIAAQAVC